MMVLTFSILSIVHSQKYGIRLMLLVSVDDGNCQRKVQWLAEGDKLFWFCMTTTEREKGSDQSQADTART